MWSIKTNKWTNNNKTKTVIETDNKQVVARAELGWRRRDIGAAVAKSLQSCPTLCDPTDSSPPGSPVPGILQARTLEWVAISYSSAWKWKVKVKSFSRVQLFCDPMDFSLLGSSIHGIFQARVPEWGAIAFSGDIGERDPKVQTSSSKINELWYDMYSVGNIANNYIFVW